MSQIASIAAFRGVNTVRCERSVSFSIRHLVVTYTHFVWPRRGCGGGVQVEAVESLSAVVHREQFDGGVRQSSRGASTHIALALHAI